MKNKCKLFGFILGTFLVSATVANNYEKYNNYSWIRVVPRSSAQLEYLTNLVDTYDANPEYVDFWAPPSQVDQIVDMLVSPDMNNNLLNDMLVHHNMNITIKEGNVKSFLENEQLRAQFRSSRLADQRSRFSRRSSQSAFGFNFGAFNSYHSMVSLIRRIAKANPDVAEVITAPERTHDGNQVVGIKIGKRNSRSRRSRPAAFIDGGIHAREWISPATALYAIKSLMEGKDRNRDIKRIIDNIDVYVFPVINPDGYQHSRTEDRFWRKNRNPNGIGVKKHPRCIGVDLNRNFDFDFGGRGTSDSECSNSYKGQFRFSEPETRNIRALFNRIGSRLRGYFALHSYSQLWAFPFGHKRQAKCDDAAELKSLAKKAVSKLKSFHETRYAVDTMANYLYPAAGMAADWAKDKANVKYPYLVELRPRSDSGGGFAISEDEIVPTGEETFAAIMVVLEKIVDQYA